MKPCAEFSHCGRSGREGKRGQVADKEGAGQSYHCNRRICKVWIPQRRQPVRIVQISVFPQLPMMETSGLFLV